MKQWLVLVVLALVIWWFFMRKSQPSSKPGDFFLKYIQDHNAISEAQERECERFIDENVTFEGGPETFKNLHKTIRQKYVRTFRDFCLPKAEVFSAKDMPEYIKLINEVPAGYVGEMTEMYKKYGIPESLRNKHMNLINSHHEQIIQNENKWYKIMEPFIKK